jgi:type I restriction enzyme S subunit
LKSPAFISALQEQTKGGIKTEIKAKTLLSINVQLPPLSEQKRINKRFDSFENELIRLGYEISNQQTYLIQLRQAILQEAIEGKLTADWRIKNPIQKGDPNFDATALLEQIKAEKQRLITEGKIQKEKPLFSINPDDIPFALPDGWVWVRLGRITKENPRNGYSPKEVNYVTSVKSLKLGATTSGYFNSDKFKYIDENIARDSYLWLEENDILIQRSNSIEYVGVSAIYKGGHHEFIYPDLMMKIRVISPISHFFVYRSLSTFSSRSYFRKLATGSQKSMPKINQGTVLNALVALPSLAEQQAIVERIDRLLESVNAIEKQVSERKNYAQKLMQAVLREAFAG